MDGAGWRVVLVRISFNWAGGLESCRGFFLMWSSSELDDGVAAMMGLLVMSSVSVSDVDRSSSFFLLFFSPLCPLSGGLMEFGVTMWCFLVSDTRIGKSVVQVDR